jgi:hypothetical protein
MGTAGANHTFGASRERERPAVPFFTTTMTAPTDDDLAAAECQLQARMRANLRAASSALEQARKTPVTKGSAGQERANPLYKVAESCDESAVRISRELRELRQQRAAEERTRQAEAILAPFAEVDAVGRSES